MAWLELTIGTDSATMENVAARLTAAGFDDLVLEDQLEMEAFLEENRACWDYIDESLQQKLQGLSQIKLYLEDSDTSSLSHLSSLLEALREEKAFGALPLSKTLLADTDWSESWKENYPPQNVGNSLVVLPYWLADSDNSGRKKVILDPGLTFGTGAHPSTQMVMEAMEECITPGAACLDLGSGSGILSITALRLGAGFAAGVDIDPKAENIARENAAYNGFSAPEFTACTGNVTADTALMAYLQQRRYDFVFVNIVADVIIALAPVLPQLLDSGSRVILSGILDSRLQDVQTALIRAGLEICCLRAKEDWRCITAKRRTS